MTKKKINKGQPAPESKHLKLVESDKPRLICGGIIGAAATFIVIWLAAVALGYLVHWTQDHCDWVQPWMIHIGHFVEGTLFVADMISLVWTVVTHVSHHVVSGWKMLRTHAKG